MSVLWQENGDSRMNKELQELKKFVNRQIQNTPYDWDEWNSGYRAAMKITLDAINKIEQKDKKEVNK